MTTMTATTAQVYTVFIKASPEQIWDAITTPEFTSKFFYGSLVDSTLEPDKPRRLSYTWLALYDEEIAKEEPSRVTWEIEPQDGGVSKLTVVHDQLEGAPKTAANVAGGWPYIISGLKTLLETGEPLGA